MGTRVEGQARIERLLANAIVQYQQRIQIINQLQNLAREREAAGLMIADYHEKFGGGRIDAFRELLTARIAKLCEFQNRAVQLRSASDQDYYSFFEEVIGDLEISLDEVVQHSSEAERMVNYWAAADREPGQ